jgi:hypothetical protein
VHQHTGTVVQITEWQLSYHFLSLQSCQIRWYKNNSTTT